MQNSRDRKLIVFFNSAHKFFINALTFFFAVYFAKIGFSGFEIGIIFAVSSIVSLLSRIPMGLLSDRLHCKNLIIFGLLLEVFQFAGLASSTNFSVILAAFVSGVIGYNLIKISSDSLFLKTAHHETISQKIGNYVSFEQLLVAFGMMVGGMILNITSYKIVFFALAIALFLLIIVAFYLPKSITAKIELFSYKEEFLQKDVLLFALFIFLFSLHYGAEQTSYGPFLSENLKLSKMWMGLYMGGAIFCMFFAAKFLTKKIANGMSSGSLLLFGLVLSGVGHIAMTTSNVGFSFIFRALHEVGDVAMFIFLFHGVYQLFPKKRIGGHLGALQFLIVIASAIGTFISGPVGEKFGQKWPIIGSGITTLLAGAFALILYINTHRNEHRANRA